MAKYVPLYQKCPACKHLCKLSDEDIELGLNECSNGSCPIDKFYVDQVKIQTYDGKIQKLTEVAD